MKSTCEADPRPGPFRPSAGKSSPRESVDCERRLSLDSTPAAMVYFWLKQPTP